MRNKRSAPAPPAKSDLQVADAAVNTSCRRLRLPSNRKEFADVAGRGNEGADELPRFLAELLMADCVDLLCFDELGYMTRDRHGAETPPLLSEREEKNSIASPPMNSSAVDERSPGPQLCAATVDPRTLNGTINETGTECIRPTGRRKQAEAPVQAN